MENLNQLLFDMVCKNFYITNSFAVATCIKACMPRLCFFMVTYTSYASSLYDPRMRKYNGPHNEWTVIFVKGCLQLRHRCAWLPDTFEYSDISKNRLRVSNTYPDSKVHGANRGPIWGRQDPGGPYVGAMNFAIWVQHSNCYINYAN